MAIDASYRHDFLESRHDWYHELVKMAPAVCKATLRRRDGTQERQNSASTAASVGNSCEWDAGKDMFTLSLISILLPECM